jgi:REP element-mobilizing transposase RayT
MISNKLVKIDRKIKDENKYIYKEHNKTLLLYHMVFVIKYRKKLITENIEKDIRDICIRISESYEIIFIEIGFDEDHIHLLIQSIPMLSIGVIVKTIEGILAREIFVLHPEIKKYLWGGNLWTSGYYVNTVGQYSNRDVIIKYIKNQGKKEYKKLYGGELCFDFDI